MLLYTEAQQDSISVNITTNPALLKNRFVCPGIIVTFTCTTRGSSQSIAWSSDEYIGQGNSMLTFVYGNHVGRTIPKPNGNTVTIAKLTRANYSMENGEYVLESTLQIDTTMRDPNTLASVTCIGDNQNDRSRSIEFQVVGKDV